MKKTQVGLAGVFSIPQRTTLLLTAGLLAVGGVSARARDGDGRSGFDGHVRNVHYRQVNLVSDLAGVAMIRDEHLVNAWGISFNPTGPFWVSANGSGIAVLYGVTNTATGSLVGKIPLEVTIPGEGNVTGQVFNNTSGFNSNLFLFASEDGTISGWRASLGTTAEVLTQRATAVYKGLTLASVRHEPVLLAANFREGTVDAYDTKAHLIGQFSDPRAPAGYAPFNVQTLDGMVFVTFAKQDSEKHDDVSGRGHGLIDVFLPRAGIFHRLVTGTDAGGKLAEINSPWGLALSPGSFREHGDQLLVGNFGSGTIMTFEPNGKFDGLLENENDQPIKIEGLWGLTVGNGGRAGSPRKLYFSAGPGGESHGLFGSLEPVRPVRDTDRDGDDD